MRLQGPLIFLGVALLAGCQSLNQAWTQSTQSRKAAATSTREPKSATAANSSQSTTTPKLGQPIHSSAPLSSFKIADRSYADETHDFKTPPVSALIPASYHGPTPITLAGGRLVTTYRLRQMLVSNKTRPVLINAQTGRSTENIPGSTWLGGAGRKGQFNDAIQSRLGAHLKALTGGSKHRTLVFYCAGVHCWSAYDAALRAINLGYRNVYWYRGGLRAWYAAGLPTVTATKNRW